MASSLLVSSMLLFVLLLLVFPHMDQAFGAQMEYRKLKGTNNDDLVTSQKRGFRKLPPFHPHPIHVKCSTIKKHFPKAHCTPPAHKL